MYLDAHRYKLVTNTENALYCVVSVVSTVLEILTQTRDIN